MSNTHTPLKPVSRRKFLKIAAITAGASTVACCGLGYAASRSLSPQKSQSTGVETPAYVYGKESSMKNRILIVYATAAGSTVGVASAIGETFGARGFVVDVKPVKDNPSTEGYQAVVIGSAVHGGQWLPEAVAYVKDHQQALKQVPVALFCVHCMNLGDDERYKKNRLAYLDAIRPLVSPLYEAFFPGMGIKPEDTNGLVRWIARTFFGGGEGDLRDWPKIRGWAQEIALL